jgi:hypothetical protein
MRRGSKRRLNWSIGGWLRLRESFSRSCATMRLVAGTADWSFGEDAIAGAVDRAESTTVEQEKETLDG